MKTSFPWRGAITAALHYTAAFLLTTLVHELGHALVSKRLGGRPMLYNSHVENLTQHLPASTEVAIALAGPLLSLAQGLVFLAWAWRQRGSGDAALWRLYLGLFGIINFLGYLLIGPLVPYGDIGQVEAIWRVPVWATVTVAVAAGFGVQWVVGRTAPLFLDFGPAGLARPLRSRLMQGLITLPWLLGSVLVTALSWPWPTPISLIYPIMSNMVLGAAWGKAMGQPYPADALVPAVPLLSQLHLAWAVAALVGVGAVFRLLAPGVAL
ncbi:zinc metalloprotease [Hymenobacter terricola]|uniref:hypothetical protein n=1 Tax=Hymenobacter terricola TaxID=2819236 RepID=UPI001B30614B|nr:hypothetical protein [Hymenobacter terricola]